MGGVPPTINEPITKLSTEIKILANKAVQNPETVKPRTKDETSRIISALITSRKKPKVTRVSGRVRITSNGFMMALAKPRSSAEITNVEVSANLMPLNT